MTNERQNETMNGSADVRHYTEADLLETYYTEPGASMPVMMHLARCSDCAARYERLSRKLRGLSACETDKPESFWSRQRASIVDKATARRSGSPAARLAAAAVFVLTAGGIATWREVTPPRAKPPATAAVQNEISVDDAQLAADPWQSEQLRDFHEVVEWESWVEPAQKDGQQL
jgi:hypothetical protein